MAINVSKDLEEQIARGVLEGSYDSPEQFLRERLKWADAYSRMIRDAVAEGAAEAERGELIAGDDVLAEIDRTIADMRRTAWRA